MADHLALGAHALREELRRIRAIVDLDLQAMGSSSDMLIVESAIETFASLFRISGAIAVMRAEGGLQVVLVRTREGEISVLEPEEAALAAAIETTEIAGDVEIVEGHPGETHVDSPLVGWLDQNHPGFAGGARRSTVAFRLETGLGGAPNLLLFRSEATADERIASHEDSPFLVTMRQHIDAAMATTRRRDELERRVEERTEQLSVSNVELGVRVDELRQTQAQLIEATRRAETRSDEVTQRAATIRRILDNVDAGFLTVTLDGRMSEERSAILSRWFGPARADETFAEYLERFNPEQGRWFTFCWSQVADGILPIEVALDQLPSRIHAGSLTLAVRYRPVLTRGAPTEVMIVVTDITADVERELAEAELHDLLGALRGILRDREGFAEFVQEGAHTVRAIAESRRPDMTLLRQIHTLKGNAAMFELTTVARLCHEMETSLAESPEEIPSFAREHLLEAWQHVAALLGNDIDRGVGHLDIDEGDRARLAMLVREGAPCSVVASILESWRYEGVERHLRRLAERARSAAQRIGKGGLQVDVESNGVRLPSGSWGPLFSALAHVIRNAIDHGIETPEERVTSGKPSFGTLRLSAEAMNDAMVIEVADDGRGVDWAIIRERAMSRGLPHATPDELVDALFSDGISTRTDVTKLSGRGIGMGAVRQACSDLGGKIDVLSSRGTGTRVRMRFPNGHNAADRAH